MRRKIAAGNWKMNGTGLDLAMLADLCDRHPAPRCDILICPPAPLIHRAAQTVRNNTVAIGAQDCHAEPSGAHTGDVSAAMLADAGASAVILGHSERRQDHGETDASVRAKAQAVIANGLTAIVCVGETLAQRDAGDTLDLITSQLNGSLPDTIAGHSNVIAYEPIWAIGTGRVPAAAQIGEVHAFIRSTLGQRFGPETAAAIRLLYGGSVKAANAAEIFSVPDVDGALVGGASLSVADFSPIVSALEASA
ncbi:triose-phosphate isomerase [Sedimentitalea sp. JM2-8]|uniref:Triosephosphate isomerase n=1 Tax=Sedimentitalea xiamensis TaxID=3050037 RepID=A0ABT7FA84_9RHOB|nr:triose-phosphate isomerase [Sedimentitalea xiamensis]MDK3072025.1 triose-phosphate isomerase [Sedimentitalea xiamensis]